VKIYIVFDLHAVMSVETFVGNGDELSPAAVASLGTRLEKLGRKLVVRDADSVRDLETFVANEEADAEEDAS
jgi:hypothetical protein